MKLELLTKTNIYLIEVGMDISSDLQALNWPDWQVYQTCQVQVYQVCQVQEYQACQGLVYQGALQDKRTANGQPVKKSLNYE